jgi:hypothetical protein
MPIIGYTKVLAFATETFSVLTNIWSVTNVTVRSSRATITAFLFRRAPMAHRPDFVILGIGELADQKAGKSRRGRITIKNLDAATMGLYTRGGIVFTAATTDWTRVPHTTNTRRPNYKERSLIDCSSTCSSIVGPLSDGWPRSCSLPAVRSQVSSCCNQLPAQEDLKYRWSYFGGDAVGSVAVRSAGVRSSNACFARASDCYRGSRKWRRLQAFGTLTLTPLSQQEYLQFQLWDAFAPGDADPERV